MVCKKKLSLINYQRLYPQNQILRFVDLRERLYSHSLSNDDKVRELSKLGLQKRRATFKLLRWLYRYITTSIKENQELKITLQILNTHKPDSVLHIDTFEQTSALQLWFRLSHEYIIFPSIQEIVLHVISADKITCIKLIVSL